MSKSVGLQLREARQERGLTLEEVAQATRIRVNFLRLLEAGEFSSLPSKAQARGFIRSYASYLEVDAASLLEEMESAGVSTQVSEIPSSQKAAKAVDASPAPVQDEVAATIRISPAGRKAPLKEADASQGYFSEIGAQLYRQRELLGLTFEEIERHTHLRLPYLQALEAGDVNNLPSPVQARGMLNNYAVFLGLDPDPLLLLFAAALQDRLASRRAAKQPVHKKNSQPMREEKSRSVSLDLIIGGMIGALMLGFVVWGGLRILSTRSQVELKNPTAPSVAEVLLATATASASPTLAPQTPLPPPTLTLPAGVVVTDAVSGQILTSAKQKNVNLQLIIQERTWLRIIVDGKVEYQGRLVPGTALSFAGDTSIEILTGNGAALRVIYNQQDVGVLGDFGEVVNLIFTTAGVIEPTPTITFTPSATSPIPLLPSPTPGTGTP